MNKFVKFIVTMFLSTLLSYGLACILWVAWFILSGGTITFFPAMQTVLLIQIIVNVLFWGMKVLLED